jgi:hypothetical protein
MTSCAVDRSPDGIGSEAGLGSCMDDQVMITLLGKPTKP